MEITLIVWGLPTPMSHKESFDRTKEFLKELSRYLLVYVSFIAFVALPPALIGLLGGWFLADKYWEGDDRVGFGGFVLAMAFYISGMCLCYRVWASYMKGSSSLGEVFRSLANLPKPGDRRTMRFHVYGHLWMAFAICPIVMAAARSWIFALCLSTWIVPIGLFTAVVGFKKTYKAGVESTGSDIYFDPFRNLVWAIWALIGVAALAFSVWRGMGIFEISIFMTSAALASMVSWKLWQEIAAHREERPVGSS